MVAIRTIGPQVCQIVQYNDAVAGPTLGLIGSVNVNGTVNLSAFPNGGNTVNQTNVSYDNLCSIGSWSYIDPPVNDSRCDGPLFGQSVIYQSASGPQHALIASVNQQTGAITVRTWPANGSGASMVVVSQYDYTGTIIGSWRYHDPPLSVGRTLGPRIGQVVLFNGTVASFIVAVNTDGTVNLSGTHVSVPYDGTMVTPNTWSYPDPAVN